MSEKELAKALLRAGDLEVSDPPSTKDLIRRILSRDRKLVTLLTTLTVLFWLAAVVELYVFMFELVGVLAHSGQPGSPALDPVVAAVHKFLLVLAASVESLSLAFLFTMILLFVTRRASLRQINASLLEITQKLDRLEKGPMDQAK